MLIIIILSVSVLAQLAAAYCALRLIKVSGKYYSWILISIALVLMAGRRVIPLFNMLFIDAAYKADLFNEVIGLILSVLMFLGVAGIEALFNERKRLEEDVLHTNEALKNKTEKAGHYLDVSEALIVELDTKGIVTAVNIMSMDILGYKPQELVGKNWFDVFAPAESRKAVQRLFLKMMAGEVENIEHFENQLPAKNGEMKTVYWHNTLIKDEGGKITGAITSGIDITNLRKTEKELGQSEKQVEKGKNLLNDMGKIGKIGGWDLDIATMKQAWTEETYEIHDQDRAIYDPNVSTEVSRFVPGDDEIIGKAVQEAMTLGKPYDLELTMVTVKGNKKNVRCIGNADMENGKVKRAYGTVQDITEKKRVEEELKRSNRELEQFAFVASHDLQEPLRAITGYIQLLEKKYSGKIDEDADRYIKASVSGAGRMRDLINDLLAFSRIESKEREFKEVDMNAVFDTVIFGLSRVIFESGAEITKDNLPVITADETQMVQLLQNLTGNAVKFHGADKARIHVGIKIGKTEYEFSVKDNGIGIEPQYFEKIFVIFQRLHTREEYPGTGIGLAICRKIVEKHGGRIWVESEQGKGTVFYFTVPKAG